MYDITIIGGGIAGLYCALKLSKTKKILIIEKKKYLGGRIYTNRDPQFEIGAGRFNRKHKLLFNLIKKYNLTPIPIDNRVDYLSEDSKIIYDNINDVSDNLLELVIEKSKNIPDNVLRNYSFGELCDNFIGKEYSDDLISFFGYTSDFTENNAYDAIRLFKLNFINTKYYILKEGLSKIVDKMKKDIVKNQVKIKLSQQVESISKKGSLFTVKTDTNEYTTKKIIMTIKPHQLEQISFFKPLSPILESVTKIPLLRIYAIYPLKNKKIWFDDLNKTTTDSILRNIIPINKKIGLIMISYTDGIDTHPFISGNKVIPENKLRSIISQELKNIFPKKNIPEPTFLKGYFWDAGVHYWKPGYNSNKLSKFIINPTENLYISGEAFSMNQAWIEGSLETSKQVSDMILK